MITILITALLIFVKQNMEEIGFGHIQHIKIKANFQASLIKKSNKKIKLNTNMC